MYPKKTNVSPQIMNFSTLMRECYPGNFFYFENFYVKESKKINYCLFVQVS